MVRFFLANPVEFVPFVKFTLNFCRISELRRDLQAAIITKANLHIGPAVENYGGETFLSQEVAINLMQEYKLAFKRCEMVCCVCVCTCHHSC